MAYPETPVSLSLTPIACTIRAALTLYPVLALVR